MPTKVAPPERWRKNRSPTGIEGSPSGQGDELQDADGQSHDDQEGYREGDQGHADAEDRAQNPDSRSENTGHEANGQPEQASCEAEYEPEETAHQAAGQAKQPVSDPKERIAHEHDQPKHDEEQSNRLHSGFPLPGRTRHTTRSFSGVEEYGDGQRKFRIDQYSAVVRSTYLRVLILQAVVLAGLWMLQQAFL